MVNLSPLPARLFQGRRFADLTCTTFGPRWCDVALRGSDDSDGYLLFRCYAGEVA